MTSIRRLTYLIPLVATLVGGLACQQSAQPSATSDVSGTSQPLAQQNQTSNRSEGRRGHHARDAHHAGAPGFLLHAALHELDLTDAQRNTISAAAESLKAAKPEHQSPDAAPFRAIADGVRAGTIDTSKLAELAPPVMPEGSRATLVAALQTLHDTLTPEQRQTLVDHLQSKMTEHGPQVRGESAAHEPHEAGGPIWHMLQNVSLSDAQRETVRQQLAAQKPSADEISSMKAHFEQMRSAMQARTASFASDKFDANTFALPPDVQHPQNARGHMDRMVKELSAVLPVLDTHQRELLATEIEKGPMGWMDHRASGEHCDRKDASEGK